MVEFQLGSANPRPMNSSECPLRCVLVRGGKVVPMSVDHKPHDPGEEERIRSAGGFVWNGRINGCLNLSRALGDTQFKQVSVHECVLHGSVRVHVCRHPHCRRVCVDWAGQWLPQAAMHGGG